MKKEYLREYATTHEVAFMEPNGLMDVRVLDEYEFSEEFEQNEIERYVEGSCDYEAYQELLNWSTPDDILYFVGDVLFCLPKHFETLL